MPPVSSFQLVCGLASLASPFGEHSGVQPMLKMKTTLRTLSGFRNPQKCCSAKSGLCRWTLTTLPPTSSLPPAAYLQPLQPPEPCLQHAPPPSTSGPLYFLLWTPGTSTWLSGSLPSGLTSMSPQRRTLPYLPTLIHP